MGANDQGRTIAERKAELVAAVGWQAAAPALEAYDAATKAHEVSKASGRLPDLFHYRDLFRAAVEAEGRVRLSAHGGRP